MVSWTLDSGDRWPFDVGALPLAGADSGFSTGFSAGIIGFDFRCRALLCGWGVAELRDLLREDLFESDSPSSSFVSVTGVAAWRRRAAERVVGPKYPSRESDRSESYEVETTRGVSGPAPGDRGILTVLMPKGGRADAEINPDSGRRNGDGWSLAKMPGEKNPSEDAMMGDYGCFFRVGHKEQVVASYRRLEHKSGRIMCFQAAIGMTYATGRVNWRK